MKSQSFFIFQNFINQLHLLILPDMSLAYIRYLRLIRKVATMCNRDMHG